MKRVSAGKYELEVDGTKYVVLKEVDEVPSATEGKNKVLVTWTPYLDGDARAFGGQSYSTYKVAREVVYTHIRENLPQLV